MTFPARILSVPIERPLSVVADYLAEPRNFPAWASGLAGGLAPAGDARDGLEWDIDGPEGPVTIRFSPPNPFGVADHWVHLPGGTVVYIPLRAVANGDGSEVMLTLFRAPEMDDARFAADAEWIERDLAALKRVLEAG